MEDTKYNQDSGLPFMEASANKTLHNLKFLTENIPGFEMFLVDKKFQVRLQLGNETRKQGWHSGSGGHEFLNFFPPEEVESLRSLLKITFESTPVSKEFAIDRDFFFIRMIPLREKNEVSQCVVVLQNITDVKRVENKLKLSKQKAEEANQAKDQFVARMSHEIRTPLNAVIGFTDQLNQTRLSKKQADYVKIIDNASHHLLSICNDILVLSKIVSRQVETEEIPFILPQLLQAVDQVLEHQHKEKRLSFHTSSDNALKGVLLGDPAKLRQVLINLAGNSIKFTPKGSVNVECRLVDQTRETQTVHFRISDTGIGISKKDIAGIFKPFHQVDNRLERSFTGCGLGLAIARDLIEAMSGKLEVESIPGQGSTFFFTLTFLKGQKYTDTDKARVDARMSFQNLRILFVDDDPVNRTLGSIILKKQKIKAEFAKSGKEAIKKFKPGRYHLVFLDINMPDVNGMEVARFIREEEKTNQPPHRTILIAMTANVVRKQLKEYLAAGMDSLMLKPYKEEMLIKKIVLSLPGHIKETKKAGKPSMQQKGKQPYNLDQLHQVTKGNPGFMQSLLNAFIENSEQMQQKMHSDLAREDYAGIGEAAHRLHPSMEQLGIMSASALLKKVEKKYLRKNVYIKDPKLIKEAILEVQKGVDAIRMVVKERQ
jgi:signal transduction histidine kinase/DNA-binding response OmpR family regulator